MSAYAKQQRLMKRYGIAELRREETFGNVTRWLAILDNGMPIVADTHRMASETGALQKFSTILNPTQVKARNADTYHVIEIDALERETVLRFGLSRTEAISKLHMLRREFGDKGLRFVMYHDKVSA